MAVHLKKNQSHAIEGKQMSKYILFGKTVLAGDELSTMEHAAIAINDATIVFVGSQEDAKKQFPDYQILDLGDHTILPGMIDSHTHTSMDAHVPGHLEKMNDSLPNLTIRAVKYMETDLYSGITTARVLGDKGYVDVIVRNEINSNVLVGPKLLVAGIGMRSIHGHGFVGVPHTGPQEFRLTCRENLFRGVDWLKIFVTGGAPPRGKTKHIASYISSEEIQTVVDEAKRAGIRTSAHCIGGEGLVNCVRAGIDVIDHAYCATEADLQLIADNDTWICLTPSVFMDDERNSNNPDRVKANVIAGRERVIEAMRKIVKSSVKYAIGSDALHGSMPLEAKYAIELGASEIDALKGITINGARLCGVADETGSIVSGKYADIIAVDGDPIKNISSLSKVSFIMKQGRIYKHIQA